MRWLTNKRAVRCIVVVSAGYWVGYIVAVAPIFPALPLAVALGWFVPEMAAWIAAGEP